MMFAFEDVSMFVIFAVILGLTICAVLVFVFFRVYARGVTQQVFMFCLS